jgi:hypothetical protein
MAPNRYACKVDRCQASFTHRSDLMRHYEANENAGSKDHFYCQICENVYYTKDGVQDHRRKVSSLITHIDLAAD